MRKTEFLTRLQASIALLEDDEQKDILDEYSQHIDMKVKEGMTEAEAIDDFGPIDELIEEILGAYHVKATAADATGAHATSHAVEHAASAVAEAAKTGYTEVKGSMREFFANAGEMAETARASISRTTRSINGKHEAKRAARADRSRQPRQPHGPLSLTGVANAFEGALSLTWRACKTACRWTWNVCVAAMAATLAAIALSLLFAFGFCLVFLFLGYPLAGVVIAALGGMVATLSLMGLTLMLIRRRPESAPTPGAPIVCAHAAQPADAPQEATETARECDPHAATRPFESEAMIHA